MTTTPLNTGHEIRVKAGVSFVWAELPPIVENISEVPADVEQLHFRRQKASQRGLGGLKSLHTLWVDKANDAVIEEIAGLDQLEVLAIRSMTASSLAPLGRLRKLKRLLAVGGTKLDTLDWVLGLPSGLEVLYLEGFTRVQNIGPLGELANLSALGFEGGMDSNARIDTLAPLAKLAKLRHLFLAATRVADKRLAPLAAISSLRHLETTVHFPDIEFVRLQQALPNLHCEWFDMIEQHGSLRQWNAWLRERLRGG